MFEKLEQCPSCGHKKFQNHLITEDHFLTHDSFALVKCQECELVFTNPRPTFDSIGAYYASDDYISHSGKSSSIVTYIYRIARFISTRRKIKLIRKLNSQSKTILDFGCGTGYFLSQCTKKGFSVAGVEPSQSARNNIPSAVKSHIHPNLSNITNKFEVITAWHVIEHVHDLRETIKSLRSLLNKKGHMIIALPNISSFDAEHYGPYWAGLDTPRHLYHFTPSSFKTLIKSLKLKLVSQYPLPFDAYYVSLLSEKYLSGNNQLFKAIKTGFISNRAAHQTKQYSSIIYVLQK